MGCANAAGQNTGDANRQSGCRASQPPSNVWSYEEAFSRNLGLLNTDEQKKLRETTIAIPGMGGVGGIHLMTLARLGVGGFRIADPDTFEVANFNRQYGADIRSVGRGKAETMAEFAKAVNPQLRLEVLTERISPENVGRFLEGADVLVDSIDFFSFQTRRLIFGEARRRGIWAVTAGPIGFSAAWLLFDPAGMSFDEYFDIRDDMAPVDMFAAFMVGLTPSGTHGPYMDLSCVEGSSGRGPSAGLACGLCAGVAAAEVVKIVLGRKPLRPAPCYAQFDAYRRVLRTGRLRWGNRGPLQRLKRAILTRRMIELGYGR